MASSESSFTKTVTLFDWWLVKTQTHLAVSGTTSKQKPALRVFSSAAIAKRFDVFTLETADGMCVVLKSFINTHKSIQNGFTAQVVKKFSLGFPNDWHHYALEHSTTEIRSSPNGTNDVTAQPVLSETRTKIKDKRMPVSRSKADTQNECRKAAAKQTQALNYGHTSNTKRQLNSRNPKTKEADAKEETTSGKKPNTIKAKRKIVFEEQATPGPQQGKSGKYVISPECLSVGRSRSGRVLLPVLEFWRNQIPVYATDRTVTGIWEDRSVLVPERGSKSEPRKKHNRQERQ